jgi:hypothetical protein
VKRRNYTREILAQVATGRVPVNSVGPECVLRYEPRSKTDPQPWTNGTYRYNGREVHTVPACGQRLLRMYRGTWTYCTKPQGHDRAHSSH